MVDVYSRRMADAVLDAKRRAKRRAIVNRQNWNLFHGLPLDYQAPPRRFPRLRGRLGNYHGRLRRAWDALLDRD